MKDAVENILEERLSLQQWQQATLPIKEGDLGLKMAADVADIAFTASHRTIRETTIQLYPKVEQRQLSNDYIDCLAGLKNIMHKIKQLGSFRSIFLIRPSMENNNANFVLRRTDG